MNDEIMSRLAITGEGSPLEDLNGVIKDIIEFELQLAKHRCDYEQAKMALGVYEAELATKVRVAPEEFGLTKTTEATIAAVVDMDKERIKRATALVMGRCEMDMLQAYVNAFNNKRRAIDTLLAQFSKEDK